MLGYFIFPILAFGILLYIGFHVRRYVLFYRYVDSDGRMRIEKRSNTNFIAFLPPSKAKIKNHRSARVTKIPFFAYAGLDYE
jgi:hypothetical protein